MKKILLNSLIGFFTAILIIIGIIFLTDKSGRKTTLQKETQIITKEITKQQYPINVDEDPAEELVIYNYTECIEPSEKDLNNEACLETPYTEFYISDSNEDIKSSKILGKNMRSPNQIIFKEYKGERYLFIDSLGQGANYHYSMLYKIENESLIPICINKEQPDNIYDCGIPSKFEPFEDLFQDLDKDGVPELIVKHIVNTEKIVILENIYNISADNTFVETSLENIERYYPQLMQAYKDKGYKIEIKK